MRLSIFAVLLLVAVPAHSQEPSRCSAIESEVTLGSLSGQRIDSLSVATAAPNVGRLGRSFGRLHVRTRHEIIQRELLFAAGDTVDTLRVAESLRRLRRLSFLENAHVEARQCAIGGKRSLALTVVTRDAWTTRANLKMSGSSPRLGVTERDLFGTGRSLGIDLVSQNGSIGIGVSTSDAFGFGTGVATRAQYQRFSDGLVRGMSFARRQTTAADPWRARLDLFDLRREPRASLSDDFERTRAELLAGLRITPERRATQLYLLGGFESEHATLVAGTNAEIMGPARVDRRFSGPEIGLALVSSRFDTLTWLLAGGGVVDLPRTLESELVVGIGRGAVTSVDSGGASETARSNFLMHYDGWVGREWLPNRKSRVVTDLWFSGYSRAGEWHAARTRAAISGEQAASKGVWRLSGAAEQLRDPDPDVRALAIYDRTLAFLPKRLRLAETALTLSLERARHIKQFSGAWELDGSLFGAFSKRWDPARTSTSSEDFSVGVAGLGLALSPRRAGRGTLRLDYGFPFLASPGLPRSPRLSITLIPWLEAARHRDQGGTF